MPRPDDGSDLGLDDPERLSPVELQAVLHELHEEGSWDADLHEDSDDDGPTVKAVAEATGRTDDEVWDVLDRLRREDAEIRLARAVRELEEPLYRVERPGHPPQDPLDRHFRLAQGESLSPLLDDIAMQNRRRSRKKVSTPKQEEAIDRLQRHDTILAIAIVAVGLLAILAVAMVATR